MEEQLISQAAECVLFKGISGSDMAGIWHYATPVVKNYEKGEIITNQGDTIHRTGIVLSGMVAGIFYHDDGRMQLMSIVRKGGCIDLTGVSPAGITADLTYQAKASSCVVFINFNAILQSRDIPSGCRLTLLANMSSILSEGYSKAVNICQILSHYRIRDRLICFFDMVKAEQGTDAPDLSITQSEMAQFLGVNRSVLSKELNDMRREGIIDFHGGRYILKK